MQLMLLTTRLDIALHTHTHKSKANTYTNIQTNTIFKMSLPISGLPQNCVLKSLYSGLCTQRFVHRSKYWTSQASISEANNKPRKLDPKWRTACSHTWMGSWETHLIHRAWPDGGTNQLTIFGMQFFFAIGCKSMIKLVQISGRVSVLVGG
jgi:hypothetical protein